METTFPSVQLPGVLKLLAHDTRWNILVLLARGDYNEQELMRLLKQPQNVLSYHLRRLLDHGLVKEQRNAADERSIYYSLDLALLHAQYLAAAGVLHPALENMETAETLRQVTDRYRPHTPVSVLFLCTENSARSQMAEGIRRSLSDGWVEAFSAGSRPSHLHPLAVETLAAMKMDISHQQSKHLDVFAKRSFDYVITVCDRVRESCPTLPGDPERIHWSFPDPAAVEGSEELCKQAFEQTALHLITRIRYLLILLERESSARG